MLSALRARGLLHSATHEAADALLGEMRVAMGRAPAVYAGFDPTADGLHVGSLVQLMALRLMQRHGLRPVALVRPERFSVFLGPCADTAARSLAVRPA